MSGRTRSRQRDKFASPSRRVLVAVLAVLLVLGLAYVVYEVSIAPNMPPAMHIHVALLINLDVGAENKTQAIPGNIGNPGVNWSDHTYDGDGLRGFYPIFTIGDVPGYIHVVSRTVRDYTLGDFFRVWGEPINSTNVVGVPNDETGNWYMFVNGVRNYEFGTLVLRDQQLIELYHGP